MRIVLLVLGLGLAANPAAAGWFDTGTVGAPAATSPGKTVGRPSGRSYAVETVASPLVGAWLCELSDPSEPGMDGSTAELEYRADGTSSARAEIRFPGAVGQNALTLTATGSWSIDGGRLVEAMTDYSIVSLAEAGVATAWADLDPGLRQAFKTGFEVMIGVVGTSTIEQRPGGRLILRDEDGAISDCRPS